jgi:hypothetical protein
VHPWAAFFGRLVLSKRSSPSTSISRTSSAKASKPSDGFVSVAGLHGRDEDKERFEAKLRMAKAQASSSKISNELRQRWASVIKSAKDETKRRRLGIHGKKSG